MVQGYKVLKPVWRQFSAPNTSVFVYLSSLGNFVQKNTYVGGSKNQGPFTGVLIVRIYQDHGI